MNSAVCSILLCLSFCVVLYQHFHLFCHVHQQGDNSAEIAQAQKMLQAVQAAYDEVDARLEEAKVAEAPFKQACEELEAARKVRHSHLSY